LMIVCDMKQFPDTNSFLGHEIFSDYHTLKIRTVMRLKNN